MPRIEFIIKTGNDAQAGAGEDSRVYCSIAGREFRLEKSGEEFKRNATDTFIAGQGSPPANITNPSEHDPSNPDLFLRNLPAETATVVPGNPGAAGTRPRPMTIRIVPKNQQKGWQLEDARVRVLGIGLSSGFPPSDVFNFRVVGGQNTNRWLGDDFGTSVELELV